MSSPWPPSTNAETSSTEMPSSDGEEVAEARRIEHAGHADHHVARQAGGLLQRPDHGVERVGDDDDEGGRGILLDAGADLLHHLDVDADEIVAAHARLARHAGGDDADVGTLNIGIGVGAAKLAVEAFDRARLGDIQRLALRQALGDVENDDIAQLLQPDQMRKRPTDHATADQGDLRARHPVQLPLIYKNCFVRRCRTAMRARHNSVTTRFRLAP